MTHTPGPWLITPELGCKDIGPDDVGCTDGIYAIAGTYGITPEAEDKANAALIATAPEMFEEGQKLANEVRGILALLESHVAEVGWTNIACLQRRLDNFDTVITKVESRVEGLV